MPVADDPETFTTRLDRARDDEQLRRGVAAAGRGNVEKYFDSKHIGEALAVAVVPAVAR